MTDVKLPDVKDEALQQETTLDETQTFANEEDIDISLPPGVEETITPDNDGAIEPKKEESKQVAPAQDEILARLQKIELENAELKGKLSAVGQKQEPVQAQPDQQSVLDVVNNASDEDIRQMMDDDPKGFTRSILVAAADLAKSEMTKQIEQAYSVNQVNAAEQAFAEKYPGYTEAANTGKLDEFMNKNFGHNKFSAYLAMEQEAITQRAMEDAQKKFGAEMGAKQDAKTLGPGVSPQQPNANIAKMSMRDAIKNAKTPAQKQNALIKAFRAAGLKK